MMLKKAALVGGLLSAQSSALVVTPGAGAGALKRCPSPVIARAPPAVCQVPVELDGLQDEADDAAAALLDIHSPPRLAILTFEEAVDAAASTSASSNAADDDDGGGRGPTGLAHSVSD